MTGTFGGLNTALSGLKYESVALDVANQNISNVNTDGYVRRRAVAATVGPSGVPAMWSTDNGNGNGVTTDSVQRLTDDLVNQRVWREHGNLSNASAQQTILSRVEAGLNEPGDNGVSAALKAFTSSWQDLVSTPDTPAARETVLAQGDQLAAALHAQSQNITTEQGDDRIHVLDNVSSINNDATELAQLNRSIKTAQLNGTDVGTLQDSRDQLAQDLASLTGATVSIGSDGQYNVAVNGTMLVNGDKAGSLAVTAGIDPSDGSDTGAPLAFAITDASGTTTPVPTTGLGGELGGVVTALTSTLPNYLTRLNKVAADLIDQVNTVHQAGYGLDGSTGLDFFTGTDAATIGVNASLTPDQVAASGVSGSLDGSNADLMSQKITVGSDYQALVTGFGTTVAAINQRATNQQSLTDQVDNEKEQTAGVNLDEETVNMVQAQHAYEASSRVMTVLDSLLDTLINHTGITR